MDGQNYGANVAQTPETVVGPRPMTYQGEANPGTGIPPRQQNLARPIQIEQLNHGYIIVVGCQRFAVENREVLLHRLGHYLGDPEKVETAWLKGEFKW